jgi:hypothetical protein
MHSWVTRVIGCLLASSLNLPWTALGGAREQIKLNWKEKAVPAKHQIKFHYNEPQGGRGFVKTLPQSDPLPSHPLTAEPFAHEHVLQRQTSVERTEPARRGDTHVNFETHSELKN